VKQLFTLSLLLTLGMASCKKENDVTRKSYLDVVKTALKDSVANSDFSQLNFNKAVLSKVDSVGLFLLRVPFAGKNIKNDFILLQTAKPGTIVKGKIVHVEGEQVQVEDAGIKKRTWNGSISISSLDRKTVLNSSIENGYVSVVHHQNNLRTAVVPEPEMPEVVVIAYVHNGGISFSDWVFLQGLFYDSGGGSSGGYYGSLDVQIGGGGGGTTAGQGYTGGYQGDYGSDSFDDVPVDPTIQIDFETQDQNDPIDLQKFVNCFNSIPDAGATCSIEIFADIPVDSDPTKLFDFVNGSPGHTFINVRKKNGSQSASQNIGFYPKSGLKTALTNAPIDGKFVDNGNHEYNASLKMDLTPAQLASTLTEILYLKNSKYDIDDYNCTDWALAVFNKTRSNKLEIPVYYIPENNSPAGTSMPQGVYNKLKQMKAANDPEAANITIGIVKGWAGNSTGPCN
jgi:hypothetical protein